jgi:hypothetical protein
MAGKWFRGITPRRAKSPDLNTSVAHPARVYDYWLGGKDNFAADREAAEAVIAVRPGILRDIRENRKFLIRAVRYLAAEVGIRQFLDLGTGIPTSPNVHEAAQQAAPECRVVYVDNDPIVLAHARALLTSTDEGATAYIQADARDPEAIVAEAAETLDFGEPIAVMMLAVLHFIPDEDDPWGIVTRLTDAVVPGSYLTISSSTRDICTARMTQAASQFNSQRVAAQFILRTQAEIARYFDGLELVPPGLVPVEQWRPASPGDTEHQVPGYGGVARKG